MVYIGRNRIHLDEIVSTNNELKRLFLEADIEHGTLLTTSFQAGGKGQMGSGWESKYGLNFLGTYFFKPKIRLADIFTLNMISSLAVKETVAEFVNRVVEIKWPNDIVVEGRKVSGILVETKLYESEVEGAFIGIGLNINQLNFKKFKREATSLKKEIGKDVEIDSIIQRLNFHLQQFYSLYELKGYDFLNFLYHQDLYLKGEESAYRIGKDVRFLILQSVNKFGNAQFFNQKGKLEEFGLKEIEFLK